MAVRKSGLGKGLDSLIPAKVSKSSEEVMDKGKERLLSIQLIEPNRNQPRKEFEKKALEELADSIRLHGVITPIIVQRKKDYYEIIAGERRWRAAKLAGLKEMPVVVRDYTPQALMEVALIENLQREDLNPIEEGMAYKQLMDEFGMTQEEVGLKVSKSRSQIANAIRLLKLGEEIRELLIAKKISYGHGRALLGVDSKDLQKQLAKEIIEKDLSVRQTEALIKSSLEEKKVSTREKQKDEGMALAYRQSEERMREILGTNVHIKSKNDQRGRVEIEYYSRDELDRLIQMMERLRG